VYIQSVIAPNALAVRYVVGVGMAYAVWTYPFHYSLVGSPDHRPIAHVVIGGVMNATMFAAAFIG
jgi:phosphoribosylcarboxyaminoimidazole (NCAIR) mutase